MIRSLDNMQTSFDFLMLMMVLTFISGIFKKLRTKKEFTGLDLFQIVLYSVMWVPLFFELYFEEITKEKFDDCSESESLERQLEEAREKLEGVKELCYDFYSAGLSAGHPMTTAQSAERELKELEKELDQLKEQGDE